MKQYNLNHILKNLSKTELLWLLHLIWLHTLYRWKKLNHESEKKFLAWIPCTFKKFYFLGFGWVWSNSILQNAPPPNMGFWYVDSKKYCFSPSAVNFGYRSLASHTCILWTSFLRFFIFFNLFFSKKRKSCLLLTTELCKNFSEEEFVILKFHLGASDFSSAI